MEKLRYADETDRCFGAAGMAVSLVIYDGEDLLTSISLDNASEADTVEMSPDFYFAGSPAVSAKASWHQMVKNYNIGVAMVIANLLCRYYVNRHTGLPEDIRATLRDIAAEEGRAACQLDDDEIDSIFEKNFSYLSRVFSHRGVQSVVYDFTSALASKRTLSRLDTLDLLSALQSL
ncbi:MAG: hypothetical protein K2H83_08135 [Duncaniella sp.]|nr:hypothetical protein [Duncaniella sp.]MDE5735089.1 hypothetical protein [Duncaniella sp.]MDE6178220.1 hypothetical protein [Duncaniella sp.]